ncbi:hypothetical protein JOM56_008943 [Amanita muscaria]
MSRKTLFKILSARPPNAISILGQWLNEIHETAATLFPTGGLAWQLAQRIPDTRKHIVIAFFKSSDSLQATQIEDQFDLLIIQPLKSTTNVEISSRQFLRVLVQAGEEGDMPICSRPERPRIHAILGRFFGFLIETTVVLGLPLFASHLPSDHAIRQPGDGTTPWLQSSDISDLVEASCGQFLYVSTVVRLLDDPHFSPRDVLEMARRSSLPTPDLNELYKAILQRARSSDNHLELSDTGFLCGECPFPRTEKLSRYRNSFGP